MRRRKTNNYKKLALVFVAVVLAAFFITRLVASGGHLFKKGVLTYSDSLLDEEKSFLTGIIGENEKFTQDLTVSAETVAQKSEDLVYDILVPTTDFYDGTQDISSSEIGNYALVSVNDLTSDQKALSVDGNYYFDDYENGAMYRVFKFTATDGSDLVSDSVSEVEDLKTRISDSLPEFPTKDTVLSINQTGVTALSRGMQTKMESLGVDGTYFAEKIQDFLKATDLTHISNEVSFSDDCTTSSGSVVLCSPWEMYSAITAIGTDIVELTGNHNNDWSTSANLDTIAKYEEDGLQTFGGGKDEETAKTPLEISQKNTNIIWIGVNLSTSTKENGQGADGDDPGANIYDEVTTKAQIEEAKAAGKFVLVDVQYSECYSYPDGYVEMPACDAPISGQEEFFRELIDFGADMVVGTQAHQPQTYEFYNGKPIYYGLGNLFFDQTYWPGTERGIILTHYFYNGKLLQTRLTPTVYDEDLQVETMDTDSAEQFLTRLIQSSPAGE